MANDDHNESDSSDYQVGYRRPPRHTQFKPGQTGNPKGRPKKSPNFAEIISRHVRKTVPITIDGRSQRVPRIEAIALKHISKAMIGDHRSTELVLGVLQASERDPGDNLPQLLQQFRAIHARHLATDPCPPPSTPIDNRAKDDEAR